MMRRTHRRKVPILMYHNITPRRILGFEKYCLSPRAFNEHIAWLRRLCFTSITLDELVRHRRDSRPLPARPVIITFDDGYRDCAEYALPTLHRIGFSACFYLVADLIGKTSEWLARERGMDLELLDVAQARALVNNGMQVGSHSMSHPHLDELDAAQCSHELASSRRVLEGMLGCPVRHLAYPYGSLSPMVVRAAREAGYLTATTVQEGLSGPADHDLGLRRVPVDGRASALDFLVQLHTGRSVRHWARRARRAGGGLYSRRRAV
jgi:peptidoglycan/xylan/chitin deacetylase (PgdA/CDA1 family)